MPVVGLIVRSPVSLLMSFICPTTNIILLAIGMLLLVDLFYICSTPRIILLIVMSWLVLKQEKGIWHVLLVVMFILSRVIVNRLQESMQNLSQIGHRCVVPVCPFSCRKPGAILCQYLVLALALASCIFLGRFACKTVRERVAYGCRTERRKAACQKHQAILQAWVVSFSCLLSTSFSSCHFGASGCS